MVPANYKIGVAFDKRGLLLNKILNRYYEEHFFAFATAFVVFSCYLPCHYDIVATWFHNTLMLIWVVNVIEQGI